MSHQPLEQPSHTELDDGEVVTIRRLNPSDADDLVRLYETLTEDECYLRFFTVHPAHLQTRARSLTDHANGQCSVGAFSPDKLLGVANYVACATPGEAEVAVVVAHAEHLRGVGTALLRKIGQIAKSNGIHRLVAEVLVQNRSMLHVLWDAGWPCARRQDGSVLHVDIDLDKVR